MRSHSDDVTAAAHAVEVVDQIGRTTVTNDEDVEVAPWRNSPRRVRTEHDDALHVGQGATHGKQALERGVELAPAERTPVCVRPQSTVAHSRPLLLVAEQGTQHAADVALAARLLCALARGFVVRHRLQAESAGAVKAVQHERRAAHERPERAE